jgi:hypothetical protein
MQFSQYAPKRPDIDGSRIRYSKDDFWTAIESTLDIGVDFFILVAAAPEIDHLDFINGIIHRTARKRVSPSVLKTGNLV